MKNSDATYSYGRQCLEREDIEAVLSALQGDWITQGPTIDRFEAALCAKFDSRYAIAVCNGTASLHLIARSLGWKHGDIILTSPITFLSTANAAVFVGATPDFVDIDTDSHTIDPNLLEEKVKKLHASNLRVKAVVGVDFAGHPCDWSALRHLADKYDFQLVNDYCHALGAEYDGKISYAAQFADAVNLSFHAVKHITTGEGGAILTNREEIYEKARLLRTHGMTKDPDRLERNDGPWYYEMHEVGYNYRITDFQCALGITQLGRLDRFVGRRREIAQIYDEVLGGFGRPFTIPGQVGPIRHSYHLYPLEVDFGTLKIDKRIFFQRLKEKRVLGQVHYIPVHLQPYYRTTYGFREGDFPVSEQFYKNEISIPIYPSLTDDDIDYVCDVLMLSIV